MTEYEVDVLHEEKDIVLSGYLLGHPDITATWLIDEDGAGPIAVRLRDAEDPECWRDVPKGSPLFQACIDAVKSDEMWVMETYGDDLPSFDPNREWGARVL